MFWVLAMICVALVSPLHCKNRRVVLIPSSHFYSFGIRVVLTLSRNRFEPKGRFDPVIELIPPFMRVIRLFVESMDSSWSRWTPCATLSLEWIDSLMSQLWIDYGSYQIAMLLFKPYFKFNLKASCRYYSIWHQLYCSLE